MDTDEFSEVPDGSAVFPPIPPEFHADPMLLAVLHAVVFIAGSDDTIVNSAAGDEALAAIAGYLERLSGEDRERLRGELKALRGFAKEQGWPKQLAEFLKTFPKEFGIDA